MNAFSARRHVDKDDPLSLLFSPRVVATGLATLRISNAAYTAASVILISLALLFSVGSAHASHSTTGNSQAIPIELTDAERTWLASLPPLKFAFDSRWPPFSYLDREGKLSGVASD